MRGKKRAPVENIPVPAVFIFALRGATAPQLPSQNAWSGGEPPRRDPTTSDCRMPLSPLGSPVHGVWPKLDFFGALKTRCARHETNVTSADHREGFGPKRASGLNPASPTARWQVAELRESGGLQC
jgi:hypothetical protein